MKSLTWMLIVFYCVSSFAQEGKDFSEAAQSSLYKKAAEEFSQGRYQATIEELNEVEAKLPKNADKSKLGFLHYWRAITYNKLQDYSQATKSFNQAIQYDYKPEDIHYEYGQALFALSRLREARIQFRESLRNKYKRGVSLYYIAFISKELGEEKKAVTFYKAIEKLDAEETKEVRQAAEMQVGDIYLEQVEKHPDSFRAVENYVIPQYQKALAVDPDSPLAPEIQKQITSLQHRYDLVMFRLINGRPTVLPPYFLRVAQEVGYDSNVTFAPEETTIAESDKSSIYSRTDAVGRYTFYHRNYLSISPELRFNYTYYFNRKEEIFRNDNYLIAPAIRTSYEHFLFKKSASFLLDYDYNYTARDINAEKKLEFSGRSHSFMIGERISFFDYGDTIFRLRHRIFDSYTEDSNSKTTSFVFEQVKTFQRVTLLFLAGYDITRVTNSIYDTDGITVRADLILPRIEGWFTPSFGLGLTSTDPKNNRDVRGRELLINPTMRLAKIIGKNWRTNLKAEYTDNKSDDEENFAFKKYLVALELEYIF